MKLPLTWLNEFVKTGLKPEALADLLTLSGSEVTAIIRQDADVSKVIVGEVKTLLQHPHADRLKVAKVDVGSGGLWEIVCGAANVRPGQRVAVAPIGAILHNGTKIEERRIRGIASQGMICSEDELGLGTDHDGIMVLDLETPVGSSLKTALGLPEVILDLDLTPNRGDCFSILGLAREVAVLTGAKIHEPPVVRLEPTWPGSIKLRVDDRQNCAFYTGREIMGVTVGPSPSFIRNRLRAAGVRPVNNVVDITNYVLFERGQPLHAFDARVIEGNLVVIRKGRPREKITTLDGQTLILGREQLVIADRRRPIALAGVMGGQGTEVGPKTKHVFIESAIFSPQAVRMTSRRCSIKTEASMRFERGVDPRQVERALDRVGQLLKQYAGARKFGPVVKAGAFPKQNKAIAVDPARVTNLLGVAVTPQKITALLEPLGFEIKAAGQELKAQVPTWRQDVSLEADIVEEVGRLMDYNKLRPTLPIGIAQPQQPDSIRLVRKQVRNLLLASGFNETLLSAFTGLSAPEVFGLTAKDHVRVANPLNSEQGYLRRSLIPGLVAAAAHNSTEHEDVRLFEIGRVFSPTPKRPIVNEEEKLSWIAVGAQSDRLVRGVLDLIVERLRLGELHLRQKDRELFVAVGSAVFARIEILPRSALSQFKLRQAAAIAVLDIEALSKLTPKNRIFINRSEFPAITRDLSFWVSPEIYYSEIVNVLKKSSQILEKISCVDVFEKQGRRSLALRFTFRARDRTLAGEEAESAIKLIVSILRERFHIEIRS